MAPSIFARVHDVVPLDGRASTDDAERPNGCASDGDGSGLGQNECPAKWGQAFACTNVVDKSRCATARSARVLPTAPGLPDRSGTARDKGPAVRSSYLANRRDRQAGAPAHSN